MGQLLQDLSGHIKSQPEKSLEYIKTFRLKTGENRGLCLGENPGGKGGQILGRPRFIFQYIA